MLPCEFLLLDFGRMRMCNISGSFGHFKTVFPSISIKSSFEFWKVQLAQAHYVDKSHVKQTRFEKLGPLESALNYLEMGSSKRKITDKGPPSTSSLHP